MFIIILDAIDVQTTIGKVQIPAQILIQVTVFGFYSSSDSDSGNCVYFYSGLDLNIVDLKICFYCKSDASEVWFYSFNFHIYMISGINGWSSGEHRSRGPGRGALGRGRREAIIESSEVCGTKWLLLR